MKPYIRITAFCVALSALLCSLMCLASCVGTSQSVNTQSSQTADTNVPNDNSTSTELPEVFEESHDLVITEIMSQIGYNVTSNDGNFHPWVELYAKKDLTLSDYALQYSDEIISFPQIPLSQGEYYVLYLDTPELDVTLEHNGTLTLFHKDVISQNVVYYNKSPNHSFIVESGAECPTPTPGYAVPHQPTGLVINELMCDNNLYVFDGVIGDWVELYNNSDSEIDLSRFWISDDPDEAYITNLPSKILLPGEYTVLRSDHELDFSLSKDGESIYITRDDGVVCSSLSFESFEENCSITRDGVTSYPSPGFENTRDGWHNSLSERSGLVINEVISSNSKFGKHFGEYYDMVEICNISDEVINLGDYYLSDKAKAPERYPLPDTILKPNDCYTVYCTGEGGLFPDFGISSKGEKLYLYKNDGTFSDALYVPSLLHNISYGRYDNKLVYFEKPTFGGTNTHLGYDEISQSPTADLKSGIYTEEITIRLEGDGDIYYTTDGSKPTLKSALYDGNGITVGQGVTNIRMICKKGDLITSAESAVTYCVQIPDYTLPLIMVSVDHEEMFGESGTWTLENKNEIEGHVAFIENGVERFSVGCGVKLFGLGSMTQPKKSLQLKFRGEYGTPTLQYKIFDDIDIDEFNSLVIRGCSQAVESTLINDEFVSSLVSTSGNMPTVPVQAYKPTNLYINGEYMGVYFIREKLGDDYFASHLGVSPESVTMIFRAKTLECGSDLAEWEELWNYVLSNDLRIEENYKYIGERFDLENVIDYYIAQFWSGNRDSLNTRVYKSSESDGKWRYILYDLDKSFYFESSGALYYLKEYKTVSRPYNALIYKLLQNDEFYARFNERLEYHLANTFTPERATAQFRYIMSLIEPDMPYEIERWKYETEMRHNRTMEEWHKKCNDKLRKFSVAYNEAYVVAFRDVCITVRKNEEIHKK